MNIDRSSEPAMPERTPQIIRRYRSCRFGQTHLRYLAANHDEIYSPLLCLHPAPYSGAWFTTVMPLLNEGRAIIAPDYPGYGGSTPTRSLPSVDDYALAMLDTLDDMNVSRADVLGFHTGCLVGAELALRAETKIARLILVDIPFFTAEERTEMYASGVQPRAFSGGLSSLAPEWDSKVAQRLEAMSFKRAFELFVESLQAGDRSHWGFHAAYTYPSDEKFPLVTTPLRVIATRSSLLEPTRRAARALPQAEFVERLDIKRAVFDEGATGIAAEIRAALN
jgi:pimeloyl-ACP methyl ester carboxylesterase